jgi:hypothetical protein
MSTRFAAAESPPLETMSTITGITIKTIKTMATKMTGFLFWVIKNN